VDFQKKVVLGLSDETPAPIRITSINETTISFTGKAPGWFVTGTLDRVTGALDAAWDAWIPDTREKIVSTSFDLQCRPAQRMF
jgi:hypothetical protein